MKLLSPSPHYRVTVICVVSSQPLCLAQEIISYSIWQCASKRDNDWTVLQNRLTCQAPTAPQIVYGKLFLLRITWLLMHSKWRGHLAEHCKASLHFVCFLDVLLILMIILNSNQQIYCFLVQMAERQIVMVVNKVFLSHISSVTVQAFIIHKIITFYVQIFQLWNSQGLWDRWIDG